MPVIRYTTGIIDWTINECTELDRLIRKQMTLYNALHPRDDVDRLYVTRKSGGRGLLSVSDVVTLEKHSLTSCVSKSKEPIMVKIREFSLLHDKSLANMSRSTVLASHCDQ